MTGDHLVDVLLRIRLQPCLDLLIRAAPQNDDPEPAGLPGFSEHFLELLPAAVIHRLPVDGHDAVARLKVGTRGRAVGTDGLDDEAGPDLDHVEAEVAAAGEHLADGALALVRRNMTLRFLRACSDCRREDGDDSDT